MTSLIQYTLDHCNKCLKCLQHCPTQAISMIDDKVIINENQCIHCGKCIDQCFSRGLKETSSDLKHIKDYAYTIALIPTSIFGCCKDNHEVYQLTQAIVRLGFDEVEIMDKIEAKCSETTIKQAAKQNETIISSNCPVANAYIKLRYPMLFSQLSKVDYPSEVAARWIRNKYKNKENIGIFYLAECIGKLSLAKYPMNNDHFEVDHALALSTLFPLIHRNQERPDEHQIQLSYHALRKTMGKSMDQSGYLNVDTIEKIQNVLELEEFERIEDLKYLNLKTCINGCVGGNLLWGNPYNGKNNIKRLLREAHHETLDIPEEMMMKKIVQPTTIIKENFKQNFVLFEQINQQLQSLPEYDCGACGYPSCRIMAEKIVEGKNQLSDCLILSYKKRGHHEN